VIDIESILLNLAIKEGSFASVPKPTAKKKKLFLDGIH
jgi:hypothetical protein